MTDVRGAGRAAVLSAWTAEVQRIAAHRRRGSVEDYPAPPPDLSPDDCKAAGLRLHDHGNARLDSKMLTLRVNFTPDLQHQTVFLVERERRGSARLWVDGEPAPVPVNPDGAPLDQTLTIWLDRRFSKGVLGDVRSPARALSLWVWITEAGRIAVRDRHSFTLDYPAPPSGVLPEDCTATGFEFYHERSAYNFLEDGGRGMVRVDFSPEFRHQAISIRGSEGWSGALFWVDAEPVPVPRDDQGDPRSDLSGDWLDNRVVSIEIGGLWDHPLLNPREMNVLGNIRGLLFWDAVSQAQHVELPEPHQAWRNPRARRRDGTWRIYPDIDELLDDRPDRVLPIPL